MQGIFNKQTGGGLQSPPGLPRSPPKPTFVAHSAFRELGLRLKRSVKRINQRVDKLTDYGMSDWLTDFIDTPPLWPSPWTN